MADLPFPYDPEILAVYDLLQNGKAFNTDCVDHATKFQSGIAGLGDLMTAMNLPEVAPHAYQMGYYATGTATDLAQHLKDQFAELPTNLGLVQGYIDDMAAISRLPGYNDASASSTARTASSGGYAFLSGVSPRAMLAPSLGPVFMAAGIGSIASSLGGGMCGSMGGAFGSIMGKANQFMGQAMGMLGQVQGMMGGLMGGGVLNMISKFGNMAGLSSIPGIGNIGSLVSGMGNIGNLGQIGALVSSIGGGGAGVLGALGPVAGLLGGGGNALGNLSQLGGIITSMAGFANQSQTIGGVPLISAQSPYAVQTQLNLALTQMGSADLSELIALLRYCGLTLETLVGTATTTLPAGTTTAAKPLVGNIDALVSQLYGLANFLEANGPLTLGDITPTITDLNNFIASITFYVPDSPERVTLLDQIKKLVGYLVPLNNLQALNNQIGTLSSTLGDYGDTTGFGNVAQTIGMGTSILGRLGSLSAIPGLGQIPVLGTLMPNMQGLMGSFGNLLNGNIGGIIGGMGGLTGQLSGLMGGIGLGNITSMLSNLPAGLNGITGQLGSLMGGGGLGGIMGGIGGMISGERGMLGKAMNSLKVIAGSFNLRKLKDNGCAGSVLNNVGSDALKSAQGGESGGTGSDGLGGESPAQGEAKGTGSGGSSGGGAPNSLYDSNRSFDGDLSLRPGDTDIYDPYGNQTSRPPSTTFTQGTGTGIGGASTALNQPFIDAVSTPPISGGDDNPPTSAQVAALDKTTASQMLSPQTSTIPNDFQKFTNLRTGRLFD